MVWLRCGPTSVFVPLFAVQRCICHQFASLTKADSRTLHARMARQLRLARFLTMKILLSSRPKSSGGRDGLPLTITVSRVEGAIVGAMQAAVSSDLEVRAHRPTLLMAVPLSMPWMLSLPGHFSWANEKSAIGSKNGCPSSAIRNDSPELSEGRRFDLPLATRTRRRQRLGEMTYSRLQRSRS